MDELAQQWLTAWVWSWDEPLDDERWLNGATLYLNTTMLGAFGQEAASRTASIARPALRAALDAMTGTGSVKSMREACEKVREALTAMEGR